ncbi:MAG TPA: hypothetical protein VGY91_15800 [Chthoniobacterales bacterium]|jgi:hypothetical protein|nr:hypothetical protein [Chthoniobacterales bacterium]
MILIRIRLANYTVGGVAGLVGQFQVAPAAGVSSAIRLTGKSPKLGRRYDAVVAHRLGAARPYSLCQKAR